jgi:hypothetical protein
MLIGLDLDRGDLVAEGGAMIGVQEGLLRRRAELIQRSIQWLPCKSMALGSKGRSRS